MSKRSWITLLAGLAILLPACRKADPRGLILAEMKKTAKLQVVEFSIRKAVFATQEKTYFWIFKPQESRFLAYAHFRVKAGIDLERLQAEDLALADGVLRISLPPVTTELIFEPRLRIDYRFTRSSFLNRLTPAFEAEMLQKTQTEVQAFLDNPQMKGKIEDRTRSHLITLFSRLGPSLTPLGVRSVRLEFRESAPTIRLRSKPETPPAVGKGEGA